MESDQKDKYHRYFTKNPYVNSFFHQKFLFIIVILFRTPIPCLVLIGPKPREKNKLPTLSFFTTTRKRQSVDTCIVQTKEVVFDISTVKALLQSIFDVHPSTPSLTD